MIEGIIAIALAQCALWMRFEHRMTVLETKLKLREEIEDARYQNRKTRTFNAG